MLVSLYIGALPCVLSLILACVNYPKLASIIANFMGIVALAMIMSVTGGHHSSAGLYMMVAIQSVFLVNGIKEGVFAIFFAIIVSQISLMHTEYYDFQFATDSSEFRMFSHVNHLVAYMLSGLCAFLFSKIAFDYFDKLKKQIEITTDQSKKIIHSGKMAAMGEMAGGVAHEINNPLTIIEGNNSIIKHCAQDIQNEMIVSRSENISVMIERISKIVINLRKFSKEDSEGLFELVQADEFFDSCLSLCSEKFLSYGIELRYLNHVDHEIKMYCNQTGLSQVVLNILNNAFYELGKKINEEKKRIEIELFKREKLLIILIKNNGGAISKQVRDKIFNPFFTTKNIGEGTGLGLSVSKGIIDSHQGDITVYSEKDWTFFEISLPFPEEESLHG